MKRIFVLLLCLCTLMAGCGQKTTEVTEHNPIPDEPPMPVAEYQRGDYVNISMPLPDGWEWESDQDTKDGVPITQYPERQGFWFWKTDEPEFRFSFTCWPNGFGMCGTGVEFSQIGSTHNLTLAEEKYEDGVYVTIIFNDVPGSYIVEGSVSNAFWEQYRDTVVDMVDNATVAEGCMTRDEAVAIATEKCNWLPDYKDVYGDFNAVEGSWRLHFASDPETGCVDCWVSVTSQGNIVKETYDAEGNDPLVWNDGNLSGTPRVDENS